MRASKQCRNTHCGSPSARELASFYFGDEGDDAASAILAGLETEHSLLAGKSTCAIPGTYCPQQLLISLQRNAFVYNLAAVTIVLRWAPPLTRTVPVLSPGHPAGCFRSFLQEAGINTAQALKVHPQQQQLHQQQAAHSKRPRQKLPDTQLALQVTLEVCDFYVSTAAMLAAALAGRQFSCTIAVQNC
jgi:hypothetical protein